MLRLQKHFVWSFYSHFPITPQLCSMAILGFRGLTAEESRAQILPASLLLSPMQFSVGFLFHILIMQRQQKSETQVGVGWVWLLSCLWAWVSAGNESLFRVGALH